MSQSAHPTPKKLACLGGRPPSEEMLTDLRKVSGLPAGAKQHFWEFLGPCLGDDRPPDLAERVARFCAAHGVSSQDLGDAIGVARHLVRGASALDLDTARFADDLSRVPGDHDLAVILVPGYEDARAAMRAEIIRGSVAEHGKLLSRVDYRVDIAIASSRTAKLRVPVVLLTLGYERGVRSGRVTMQATVDGVRDLRDACNRILLDIEARGGDDRSAENG